MHDGLDIKQFSSWMKSNKDFHLSFQNVGHCYYNSPSQGCHNQDSPIMKHSYILYLSDNDGKI